jgi:Mannosyltransferase (PIG-V)
VFRISRHASLGSVAEDLVSEDKPSAGDMTPAAPETSVAKRETGKGSNGLLFVLAVCAVSRLFYLVAGTVFANYLPAGPFHWITPDVPLGRLNLWSHWDGVWYSQIAAEGYTNLASTAFFPLYPLLMRSFADLFGGPLSLGALSLWGVLISLAAFPFALYFIYQIAQAHFSEQTAKKAVLALCFFPTTFFFNAVYTESLFLALSAGSLWAVRVRKNLLLGCALAAFASATRNVGVFLVVPLAYEWLKGGVGREGGGEEEYGWGRALGCLALAPSGLAAYAVYLWVRFGDLFLFYSAQSYWNRRPINLSTLATDVVVEAYESVVALLEPPPPADSVLEGLMGRLNVATDAYNLLFLLFAVALLLLGLRVLPFSLSAYAFLLSIPTVFFGKPETPLMAFPRYVLVAFPLFITLAVLLKNRRLLGGWLTLSGAASLVLCAEFVSWRFVA